MCGRVSVYVWGQCGLHCGSVELKSFFFVRLFVFVFVSAAVAVGCCAYVGVRMAYGRGKGLRRDVSKRKET